MTQMKDVVGTDVRRLKSQRNQSLLTSAPTALKALSTLFTFI
jgi:hypothetical protein